jgi:hypothetical protein
MRTGTLLGLACCALLLTSRPAWSACSVGPVTPEPAWIGAPNAGAGGFFYGVGVADIDAGTPLAQARQLAQTRAGADAAQAIQVNVKSEIRSTEGKVSEAGRTVLRTQFDAIAQVSSSLSLRAMQASEQWIDAAACRIWVRVRVPESEAALARRSAVAQTLAARIKALLAQAASGETEARARRTALIEAEQLLPLVEENLADGFVARAVRFQIDSLEAQVGAAGGALGRYESGLARHAQAFAALGAAVSNTQRRAAAAQALQTLLGALAAAPPGSAAPPFALDERVATLHREANAPCLGAQWFAAKGKALPAGMGGACDALQVARERRALYLAGRPVALNCQLQLDGKRQPWGKACALMQAQLAGEGAVLLPEVDAGGVRIALSASGKLLQRAGDGGQQQYSFQGRMQTSAQGPERLSIADDYEGVTGWNPISAAMASDLLAMAVFKKFDAALTAYWENQR